MGLAYIVPIVALSEAGTAHQAPAQVSTRSLKGSLFVLFLWLESTQGG
jgi:hypothetical protein